MNDKIVSNVKIERKDEEIRLLDVFKLFVGEQRFIVKICGLVSPQIGYKEILKVKVIDQTMNIGHVDIDLDSIFSMNYLKFEHKFANFYFDEQFDMTLSLSFFDEKFDLQMKGFFVVDFPPDFFNYLESLKIFGDFNDGNINQPINYTLSESKTSISTTSFCPDQSN